MQQSTGRYGGIKRAVVSFCAGAGLLFTLSMLYNIHGYYYDSRIYWQLGRSIVQNGSICLSSYPPTYRGVGFPIILSFCHLSSVWLGGGAHIAFRLLSSVWISFILTVALPYFYTQLLPDKHLRISVGTRLGMVVLMILFWRGLILYPLTDFYAFSFMLISACLLFAIVRLEEDHKKNRFISPCSILSAVGAGFFAYAAYNFRTIYLFAAAGLFLLAIRLHWRKGFLHLMLIIGCMLAGSILCSLPQIITNYYSTGTLTMSVLTSADGSYPHGLFAYQCLSGILYQRCDAFTPTLTKATGIKRFFLFDPVGQQIFQLDKLSCDAPLSTFFRSLFRHPLEILGIYVRHLINMLNPVFGEIYIENSHQFKLHLTLINYLMMVGTFIGLLSSKVRGAHSVAKKTATVGAIWGLLPLILPCVMLLPGAVELRFFLPIYLLMYAYLLFAADWKSIIAWIRERRTATIIVASLVFIVLLSIWSAAFANSEYHLFVPVL